MNPQTTTSNLGASPSQAQFDAPRGEYAKPIWPRWFMLSAGGILLFGGIAKLLEVSGNAQQLEISDPIFGIYFRHLLFCIGIVELIVACLCLFTQKTVLSLWLVAWLVANFVVYRIGLWTMGWYHPYVWLQGLMTTLNASPFLADVISLGGAVFLLTGSFAIFWVERQTAQAAKFQKIACPSCGGRVKFSAQNIGQQIPCPHCQIVITLRKPDENLKMSCFFCKEHIEFPIHALGQKIKCPHCQMDMILMEKI